MSKKNEQGSDGLTTVTLTMTYHIRGEKGTHVVTAGVPTKLTAEELVQIDEGDIDTGDSKK